ncbi:MAG: response regulator, partial [Gemmatimonadetes bacterium]|nr:response regulator [Gemmatimonadota bacterium]
MEVLIAEDDPSTRRTLEAALTKWGYDVRSHGNGRSALEELEQEDAPRLAILDWLMPGMDGVEVCRRLRQSERTAPPYLILLTSLDCPKDLQAGLD